MATYGTYSDFIVRFPAVARDANAVNEVNSYFLPAASAWVEEQFAGSFVIPFSNNVTSIPEFVYERAYAQIMLRSFGRVDVAKELMADLTIRVNDINSYGGGLSTTSGPIFASALNPSTQNVVYDSKAGYQPTFGLDGPFTTRADPDLVTTTITNRGIIVNYDGDI